MIQVWLRFSNRIGDIGLLIIIGFIVIYGSWDVYITDMRNGWIYVMILLAAITERTFFPLDCQ